MRVFVCLCLFLLFPNVAHAKWLEVSSAHFVVYADDHERNARRFAEQLERYHSALSLMFDTDDQVPSPSNRVTIYVVGNEDNVRRLYGNKNSFVGGFYIPSVGGSIAIVPDINGGGPGQINDSMITLLHEYAHHFLISTSSFPMPRWLSEGAAEFFASTKFRIDGGLSIGYPAYHRAAELNYAKDVRVAELFDQEAYAKRKSNEYDAFYGKSWLLYHYLMFAESRGGQMQAYRRGLWQGMSSRDAALAAFGNFEKLDEELTAYRRGLSMLALNFPPSALQTGEIAVRALREGEAAMMPVVVRSRRGVSEETAASVLEEARAIASRFPGDAAVLSALAEAEYDAGNDKEAVAAADAALAIDPAQVNAYVQKGYALFRMARDADDTAAAYAAARKPFILLNRLENDHPLPLVYFYRSFVEQGKAPSELAMHGLEKAVQLAPFDLGLRMTLATKQLFDKRFDAARANLVPIAYNPHGGSLAETAQKILARLDSDPAWDGVAGMDKILGGTAGAE